MKKRNIKQSLAVLVLLVFLVVLYLFSGRIYATENDVICNVDWVSEDSAEVAIRWRHPDARSLMITGWQMAEDKILNIYYQVGGAKGYDKRMITLEGQLLPAKLRLLNSGQSQENKPIFSDMTGITERDNAIANLYYQGILGGYPDGSFAPNRNVSRAEFAKILCEAIKLSQVEKSELSFADIENNWAKGYILALSEKGLVKGKSEGIFDPNGNISLGEVFALLDRSFYLYGKPASDTGTLASHWSNGHFLSMKGQAVIKPTDDIYASYPAGRLATRAEVALFISRILEQKHNYK